MGRTRQDDGEMDDRGDDLRGCRLPALISGRPDRLIGEVNPRGRRPRFRWCAPVSGDGGARPLLPLPCPGRRIQAEEHGAARTGVSIRQGNRVGFKVRWPHRASTRHSSRPSAATRTPVTSASGVECRAGCVTSRHCLVRMVGEGGGSPTRKAKAKVPGHGRPHRTGADHGPGAGRGTG